MRACVSGVFDALQANDGIRRDGEHDGMTVQDTRMEAPSLDRLVWAARPGEESTAPAVVAIYRRSAGRRFMRALARYARMSFRFA